MPTERNHELLPFLPFFRVTHRHSLTHPASRVRIPFARIPKHGYSIAKTTEITNNELSDSNFYTTLQEVYSDRCLGGTGACYIGGDATHPLHFVHVPLGTFAIAENGKGHVTMLVRKFRYTPQQAADEWGLDNLPGAVCGV